MSTQFKNAIEALNTCVTACEHCASSCLQEDHVQMMVRCIQLDRDCADICRLTAALLARGSKHGRHLMKECIEICELRAQECEKHDHDHCKACAEACRKCAEACRMVA